jgi:hypothetical protein
MQEILTGKVENHYIGRLAVEEEKSERLIYTLRSR